MAAPGAGLLNVTTQVACPFGFSDAGVQLKAETWASAVRVSGAEAVLPLSEAVIWAELSVVNDPAVAVKLAVVAPEAGVTDAGTETFALLELSAMDAPERSGLAESNHTGGFSIWVQRRGDCSSKRSQPPAVEPLRMLPAFTETGMPLPAESERTTCVTWIADDVLVAPGAMAKVNWATVPSANGVLV